jgi:hypothetical protein
VSWETLYGHLIWGCLVLSGESVEHNAPLCYDKGQESMARGFDLESPWVGVADTTSTIYCSRLRSTSCRVAVWSCRYLKAQTSGYQASPGETSYFYLKPEKRPLTFS